MQRFVLLALLGLVTASQVKQKRDADALALAQSKIMTKAKYDWEDYDDEDYYDEDEDEDYGDYDEEDYGDEDEDYGDEEEA
jgi:hypothetical protein